MIDSDAISLLSIYTLILPNTETNNFTTKRRLFPHMYNLNKILHLRIINLDKWALIDF